MSRCVLVAVLCVSAATPRLALGQSPSQSVTTRDPITHGVRNGALIGAGALFAALQAEIHACRKGCEWDMPAAAALLPAALGAGIGSVVGFLADRDAGQEVLLSSSDEAGRRRWSNTNRFFPGRPTVRIGPVYSQMAFRSAQLRGSRSAPGLSVAVQVSPHISTHIEYTADSGRISPAPDAVPDSVLQNVVPATNRSAGWSHGIASRRVRYVFSELIGVAPSPWGRLRVEFVGGLGIQSQEDRDYYDAYLGLGQGTIGDPSRAESLPGKYYVLDFESPDTGLVLGVDTEIALARGLTVVPVLRYNQMGDPGPSVRFGVGAHWRF